jgi:hypothetical protein
VQGGVGLHINWVVHSHLTLWIYHEDFALWDPNF